MEKALYSAEYVEKKLMPQKVGLRNGGENRKSEHDSCLGGTDLLRRRCNEEMKDVLLSEEGGENKFVKIKSD